MEYSSVIWSPRLIHDIMKIEKVQRHFTKRLRGLKHLSYSDRLNKLGLPSLELLRLHLDLVYCYKIVFGLVELIFSDYFNFQLLPQDGICTNCINIDVTATKLAFSQTELLTCGTVYLGIGRYPVDNQPVEEVDSEKDLGLY